MPPAAMISDRSGPYCRSALAGRSSSRSVTVRPSKRNNPAIPLMGNACASFANSAKLNEAREGDGLSTPDDDILVDLDPGMRDQRTIFPGNAEAKSAHNTSPAQHGVRR